MRFNEIGQQLRAYRMESGLKAEEISARLGVSRAAFYRYEKGEVIKLDTVNRLAELLKISPLTLLGIGVEYYAKPVGYAERLRQIEETSDQILQVFGPVCYLITSDQYDSMLAQMFEEHAELPGCRPRYRPRRCRAADERHDLAQAHVCLAQTLHHRHPHHQLDPEIPGRRHRRPAPMSASSCASPRGRWRRAKSSWSPTMMESEPIGLQLGLMAHGEPNGPFTLLRSRERATLAINPFPSEPRRTSNPASP